MLRLRHSLRRQMAVSMSVQEWTSSDDYEILSTLGKGSSARVFMGVNVLSGQRVVIKTFKQLPVEAIRKQMHINQLLLAGLDQQTKNKEFIHMLDACYDYPSSTFTLIYQFYHGVPLNQLISTMSLSTALTHSLTLANTLRYVHSMGIIHRDIKPANVLITPQGPKLFDFGLAKTVQDEQPLPINNFGTKCYKPPQVVYRMDTYGPQVDVWGLGLIMAQLALNKRHLLPFDSEKIMLSQVASLCQLQPSDRQLFRRELQDEIKIDKGKSWSFLANRKQVPPAVIELVRAMLQIDPKNRPTLDQVISHPAFKVTL